MAKASEKDTAEIPLEGMVLNCGKEKYKLSYAAIRWAREIKQKENLPDPVQFLVPRALRDILTGKMTIKEVEKLPIIAKVSPPPAPAAAPTLTLNLPPEEKEKGDKDSDK